MLVSDFNYDLPEELIAQQPPAERGASRMMTLDRRTGESADHIFAELPSVLRRGDLLVVNDSRVIPARLFATRRGLTTQHNSPAPSGHIEVLLTQCLASQHNDWTALVKPAIKVQVGETLYFSEAGASPLLTADVIGSGDFGERTLRFEPTDDFHGILERIGHLPLPPYIRREKSTPNTNGDRERYQTVYSQAIVGPAAQGSSAAPTAGLHFTPEVLYQLQDRGVEIARLTLHVGLGTFQPVRVTRTEDIHLHSEPYTISEATAAALNRARSESRRVIAVGTTSTRTLEHIARLAGNRPIEAHSGSTNLFLSPELNDQFHLVQGLLTNFHLPQSTLIMLVSAFAGRESTLAAYRHAVAESYRFFSYGDCMLIT